MKQNTFAGELLAQLGASLNESETTSWAFGYVSNFTAVNAGSSKTATARIDAGVYFIVQAIQAVVTYGATNTVNAPAIANYPFSRAVDATAAAAMTNAHIDNTKLRFSTSSRPWMDAEVHTGLITGEPGRLFVLPTPIVVAPNNTIETQLYNNLDTGYFTAPATIDAQIVFQGMKVSASTVANYLQQRR